jgi:hypothetical protein
VDHRGGFDIAADGAALAALTSVSSDRARILPSGDLGDLIMDNDMRGMYRSWCSLAA